MLTGIEMLTILEYLLLTIDLDKPACLSFCICICICICIQYLSSSTKMKTNTETEMLSILTCKVCHHSSRYYNYYYTWYLFTKLIGDGDD